MASLEKKKREEARLRDYHEEKAHEQWVKRQKAHREHLAELRFQAEMEHHVRPNANEILQQKLRVM